MLWKCQIFPLRVPVVIEMCCCVGKCPVGSQKTILSYAPIADRECHCYFLVYECWDWYEKNGTCIIRHHHWPLVINSIFSHLTYLYVIFSNTFASFLGIFQYSLIVMSRVDFFSLSDSTYVIRSRIVCPISLPSWDFFSIIDLLKLLSLAYLVKRKSSTISCFQKRALTWRRGI